MSRSIDIQRVFRDVDMRNQHDGLAAIARRHRVNLDEITANEIVVFMNRAQNNKITRVKVWVHPGIVSYQRFPHGVNIKLVEQLAHCIGADGKVNWTKADREALEKDFNKWERNRTRKAVVPTTTKRTVNSGQREASL